MKNKISNKQFTVYIIIAFVSAWILQIIASVFANKGNDTVFKSILMVSMFMPLLAVLTARIPLKGMGFVPHLKGRVGYVFFSLWVPALLSTAGGLLFFAIFPDAFDPQFRTMYDILEKAGALEQLEAQGLTVGSYMLISLVMSLTIAPFINILPSLGEEIGWRGAMYPYLKEKLGVTKGRIAGGLIWGIWHFPVMILAGYEYGKDYIGAPVLGPAVFCIFTVSLGILDDYVYERTETIWVPALLHGALNAFTIFAYIVKPEYADKSILGPVSIGLISMIPSAAAAAVICIRSKGRSAQPDRAQASLAAESK